MDLGRDLVANYAQGEAGMAPLCERYAGLKLAVDPPLLTDGSRVSIVGLWRRTLRLARCRDLYS